MSVRLRVVAVMVIALVLATAAPAMAAGEVRFISPPTPKAGATVQGSQTIKVEASIPGLLGPSDVESVTVTIRPRPGFKAGSPVSATQEGGNFTMAWDTRGSTPYNGGYDIEATAKAPPGLLSGPQTYTAVVENVVVNNPPSAPTGVKSGLESGAAVVRWNSNPEPDVTSYKVSRSVDGGSFTHLASIEAGKTLVYTDSAAPAGKKVKYQVAAVRRSAVNDGGLVSEPAESSEITIPGAEPQQAGQAPGQPAASGQPAGPGPAVAPPIAGPSMAPTLPIAKKAPPPPIYKSRPGEIAFAPTLPFSEAPPPQSFDTESESSDEDLAAPSSMADNFTATNPTWFIAIGVVLLAASVLLARKSRKLLRSSGTTLFGNDFLAGADFSSLGQIELPPVEVPYPTFKAPNRVSGAEASSEQEPSNDLPSTGQGEPQPVDEEYPSFTGNGSSSPGKVEPQPVDEDHPGFTGNGSSSPGKVEPQPVDDKYPVFRVFPGESVTSAPQAESLKAGEKPSPRKRKARSRPLDKEYPTFKVGKG
jgi:hypothetical protein